MDKKSIWDFFANNKTNNNLKDNKNRSSYTEDKIDSYNLTDEEKEEVIKGNQEPWSFEEEDLEDDDYYLEDD